MQLKFPKGSKVAEKKARKTGRAKKTTRYTYKPDDKIENLAIKNFQKYIRMRDAYNGGYCISCGKWIVWNDDCDAGHYIGRRHKATLFDEMNCNVQCKSCNQWKNGNLAEYRIRLIKKIGLEEVERLERDKNKIMRRKRVEFIALNEFYLKKIRDIKRTGATS